MKQPLQYAALTRTQSLSPGLSLSANQIYRITDQQMRRKNEFPETLRGPLKKIPDRRHSPQRNWIFSLIPLRSFNWCNLYVLKLRSCRDPLTTSVLQVCELWITMRIAALFNFLCNHILVCDLYTHNDLFGSREALCSCQQSFSV